MWGENFVDPNRTYRKGLKKAKMGNCKTCTSSLRKDRSFAVDRRMDRMNRKRGNHCWETLNSCQHEWVIKEGNGVRVLLHGFKRGRLRVGATFGRRSGGAVNWPGNQIVFIKNNSVGGKILGRSGEEGGLPCELAGEGVAVSTRGGPAPRKSKHIYGDAGGRNRRNV